ncbi:hypothetical protein OE88DRAFT_1527443 [Heliocybe sulcata]|uniref:Uncharacterized protein n=1 Tax=Heliocybe sulcata TaxID=5364 RepID=A0A5C3N0M5_9AGAM|nr:hypothetical protein OE88DRAFT_1527443 [Heliocybe sulcata]
MTAAFAFPNSRPVKRLPNKRRKLAPLSSVHDGESVDDKSAEYALSWPTKPLACESCHRSLNIRGCPVIICPRCNATTCAVCSRTCDTRSALNPGLASSLTPPAMPDRSPRRAGLSLSSVNMNVKGNMDATPAGKRRKFQDDEDEDQGKDEEWEEHSKRLMPGCGRAFCRNCCIEDAPSNKTTCCDCYGRA